MYRIIAGKWKAKKVAAPKNFTVRPTTDFAKEALFSILNHQFDISFVSVLDLFAGIGSISLEFASRDCPDITSVENHPKHIGFIRQTAIELEVEQQINLQKADVFDWLKKNKSGKTYDIIFADPPFEFTEKEYDEIIRLIFDKELLKPEGLFILEHQAKFSLDNNNKLETRKYGNIGFSFFGR